MPGWEMHRPVPNPADGLGAQRRPAWQSTWAGVSADTHARALVPQVGAVVVFVGCAMHVPPEGMEPGTDMLTPRIVRGGQDGKASTVLQTPDGSVTELQKFDDVHEPRVLVVP